MEQEKAKKPFGRSLSDFRDRSAAEQILLDACREGNDAVLGEQLPSTATDANRIRANFLRFLLLGGDEQSPVHECGVAINGGYIEGHLYLSGATVPVDFILTKCFFPERIHAQDAKFNGVLILTDSHLAKGIVADRLKCTGSLFMRGGFKSDESVILTGSQINGDLDLTGAAIRDKEGVALSLYQSNVSGSIEISNGFNATGKVDLTGVNVMGGLNFTGGKIEVEKGVSLSLIRAKVNGTVDLKKGFKAKGRVSFQGARIGESLACDGAIFSVETGDALSLERAVVEGSVFLRSGFSAEGCVNLTAARIGSILSCTDSNFDGKKASAIKAERLSVAGNFFMRKKFHCSGSINLTNAKIGGNLVLSDGVFESEGGISLSFESAVVDGVFAVKNLNKPIGIDVTHAKVGVLDDDLNVWAVGSILDGFCYSAFGRGAPTSGELRLRWINSQEKRCLNEIDFRPQPWRQLQRVLRELGHIEDAKFIGIKYEDKLRKIGRVGESPKDTPLEIAWLMRVITRGAHWIFGQLAGYGYRPVRLVIWMLGVWLFCGAAYWWLALPPRSAVSPSDPLIFQNISYQKCRPDYLDEEGKAGNWYLCSDLRGEYATFSPFAYSLDLLLPVVDLGQEKSWDAFIPETKAAPDDELFRNWHWGHGVRLITWFETLFGWISSLLLVAIISGFSRRNDEN